MNTVDTLPQLRAAIAGARSEGKRIALVPTMGNLHAGHIALINQAVERADFVVASIFVNPLQFGPNEDLDSYPRTLAADQSKLLEAGCNLLFTPDAQVMYPQGMAQHTIVSVPGVSTGLCGGSRPGHFDGVSTVVCKLLNMVQPDIALFGEKDYQQLAVIRKMVADLNMPVQVFGVPIVRDHDGLALSSRNGYLNPQQRANAPALQQSMQAVKAQIINGNRDYAALFEQLDRDLQTAGFRLDYVELRDALSLQPADVQSTQLVLLAAAYLGSTRLIDNLIFDL
ncbi:MAG: pantoate--beta-alanine ligase [Pseudomonas sp.]|jgi:pantoate--beta-alanine ligase|nr:pantoate--beta-alanine ligase [Pseudomonas sp.]MDD2223276.1 pantoate--beta-alanine ligase [Pseudomonas sp.]MDY0415034.1 pantoate--beta-alanine ligase [Pseudomonas sp.]NLO53177.1 pantoate--beta-alanine ligase [Gammaproteobacteria bacterium]